MTELYVFSQSLVVLENFYNSIDNSVVARVSRTIMFTLVILLFTAEDDAKCQGCSQFAQCQNGICVCVEPYNGDGYNCTRKLQINKLRNCAISASTSSFQSYDYGARIL